MKKRINALLLALLFIVSSVLSPISVSAEEHQCFIVDEVTSRCLDQYYVDQGFVRYDPRPPLCETGGNIAITNEEFNQKEDSEEAEAEAVAAIGAERDYAGRAILNQAQIDAIEDNKSVYEEAAKEADIPWAMLAVIHLRETNLGKVNPGNGQGIYQNSTASEGEYPEGEVTDAEFLKQTKWAANFLKGKAPDGEKLTEDNIAAIKDTFFGYNGRASVYTEQAKEFGFSEGYEGSPYVVNKIDAERDPGKSPETWGQIKQDGGPIEYPANEDYGAFVVYASIMGIQLGGCLGGGLADRMAQIAISEWELWESGAMSPGFRAGSSDSFSKYMNNQGAFDWCAMFASWVMTEAGQPLVGGNRGSFESYAEGFREPAKMDQNNFVVHNRVNGYDGYTPKPGDFATFNWDGNMSGKASHVNIIVEYNAENNTITTIGGNEGSESWSSSKVRKYEGRSLNASVLMSVTEVR